MVKESFAVSGPTLWNTLPQTVRDQSSTLTQFCAPVKTVLFCRADETLPQCLSDSLGCKDCCANTNVLTYLLKLKFHWDQFPRNFPVANVTGKSPTSYEEVTRKLTTFRPSRHVKMVWRVANFLVTSC